MKTAIDILLSEPNEVSARAVLRHAADYLYANQLGDPSRVRAMDLLDDTRRNSANWTDLF